MVSQCFSLEYHYHLSSNQLHSAPISESLPDVQPTQAPLAPERLECLTCLATSACCKKMLRHLGHNPNKCKTASSEWDAKLQCNWVYSVCATVFTHIWSYDRICEGTQVRLKWVGWAHAMTGGLKMMKASFTRDKGRVSISNQAWTLPKLPWSKPNMAAPQVRESRWIFWAPPFELRVDCGSVQGHLGMGPTMAIATATYICGLAFA